MTRMQRFPSGSHWGAFQADVWDGRLVGTAPFDGDPDPSDLNTVWPEMVYSPLRVGMPAVRKGWLDGDGGARRGEDGYVEMPWDEALDLAAAEMKRIRAEHGDASVFGGSYGWSSAGRVHHARTLLHRFLNVTGGFTGQVTNYSYGAAMAFIPRIVGQAEGMTGTTTSFSAIARNAEILLAFGGLPAKNWEMQSGGFGLHAYPGHMKALADNGVDVLVVSPFKGDSPDFSPARWQPIRPNTDAALVLAMIRLLVVWDRHDRAFLDRYTVGFDRLLAYLDGETDGIAKTPEWAAAITGIDAARIEELTRSLVGRRVMMTATWGVQRARHGEQPYWAIIALACALGQVGLEGLGYSFGHGSMNGMGNDAYATPLVGIPAGTNKVGISIPVARVADLLLQPGETLRFNGAEIVYPDIRMVYWAGGNPFHHHQDLNRLQQAFRRPDTVIVNEQYWTSTARHADFVFPATTALERNDLGGSSRDPVILSMNKAIEPVGGARDDFDIFAGLAERLGAGEAFTEGRTADEWLRRSWDAIRERLARRGIDSPDFEGFRQAGRFTMPDNAPSVTQFAGFRADPGAAPLGTPSGLIELFSADVAAMNDPQQPGHPVWNDPEEWLGASLAQTYPLHLLTPQPARRLHGQMDASSLSRANKRNGRERLRMNAEDALARGIAEGDIVRIFNARGACFASAELRHDVMRGVVLLPTGATFDPDGSGADRNSNPNVLTRDVGTSELGQGCAAQSCLVEVELHTGHLPELTIYSPPEIRGK